MIDQMQSFAMFEGAAALYIIYAVHFTTARGVFNQFSFRLMPLIIGTVLILDAMIRMGWVSV